MPTHPHPIDAAASRGLVAAFILIVGFGVLALAGEFRPGNASMQDSSPAPGATRAVAELGQ
jgi:hypothetical protein